MPESSALLNVVYTDYTENDFNPNSAFSGEDTPGFTLLTSIRGIPKFNSREEPVACSLALSFGDPNYGPRIGKTFHFGPTEYEIPANGEIIAMLTIGYLGNNFFGTANGTSVLIPSGIGGSTAAAFFNPGNSESNIVAADVTVITPGQFTAPSGSPPDGHIDNLRLINGTIDEVNDRFYPELQFEYNFESTEDPLLGPNRLAVLWSVGPGSLNELCTIDKPLAQGSATYNFPSDCNGGLPYVSNWSSYNPGTTFNFFITPYILGTPNIYGQSSNPISISIGEPPYLNTWLTLSPTPPVAQQLTSPTYVNNLSGIYVLNQNQRHDVVYNRAPFYDADSLTKIVKIPNPRYRTAFLP